MKVFRGVAVSMIDQRRSVCACGLLGLLLIGVLLVFDFSKRLLSGNFSQNSRAKVFGNTSVFVTLVPDRNLTAWADFSVHTILGHSVLLSNICAIPLVADL